MRSCYLGDNPAPPGYAFLPSELCCFCASLYLFVLSLRITFWKHGNSDSPLSTRVSGYSIKIVPRRLFSRNNKLLVSSLWSNSGDPTEPDVTTSIVWIQSTFKVFHTFLVYYLYLSYFMSIILCISFTDLCITFILISIKGIDTENPTQDSLCQNGRLASMFWVMFYQTILDIWNFWNIAIRIVFPDSFPKCLWFQNVWMQKRKEEASLINHRQKREWKHCRV